MFYLIRLPSFCVLLLRKKIHQPTTITRTTTPIAQHQTNQMGNVIQIQKPNSIAINKTSINVNNLKSTKANQQQTIKLVNQTMGGVSGSTNATAAQIKHGNASVVKTITSTAINTMSNPITIQPKNQTKTAYSVQSAKIVQQQQPQTVTIATNAGPQSKSQLSSAHSNIITHSR